MDVPADGPATRPSLDPGGLRRAVRALTDEIAELRAERADRHLLDLATGILVAQLSTPPSAAADHLSRLAASTGVDAPDVAADIVNAAAGSTEAAPVRPPPRTTRQRRAGYDGPTPPWAWPRPPARPPKHCCTAV